MSRIDGISGTNPLPPSPVSSVRRPADAPAARPADRLELSGLSHLLKALGDGQVRTEKVAAIRAQIEAGTYEDEQKLDVAVARLLEDLEG
jgi:anti-sigma28 factor (negative regulator of flagellin synthesis)